MGSITSIDNPKLWYCVRPRKDCVLTPIVTPGDCALEGFHDIYLEPHTGNNG